MTICSANTCRSGSGIYLAAGGAGRRGCPAVAAVRWNGTPPCEGITLLCADGAGTDGGSGSQLGIAISSGSPARR